MARVLRTINSYSVLILCLGLSYMYKHTFGTGVLSFSAEVSWTPGLQVQYFLPGPFLMIASQTQIIFWNNNLKARNNVFHSRNLYHLYNDYMKLTLTDLLHRRWELFKFFSNTVFQCVTRWWKKLLMQLQQTLNSCSGQPKWWERKHRRRFE